jgi:hypothetical protein
MQITQENFKADDWLIWSFDVHDLNKFYQDLSTSSGPQYAAVYRVYGQVMKNFLVDDFKLYPISKNLIRTSLVSKVFVGSFNDDYNRLFVYDKTNQKIFVIRDNLQVEEILEDVPIKIYATTLIDIPDYITDRASLDMFEDPVIAFDGTTYERSSAEAIIANRRNCYILNQRLKGPLYPNNNIKKAVEYTKQNYKEKQDKLLLKAPRKRFPLPNFMLNNDGQPYNNPVVASDGNTYQKAQAIVKKSKRQLRGDLFPNIYLKTMINEWLEKDDPDL